MKAKKTRSARTSKREIPKKPYTTPELVEYGDLRRIVNSKASSRSDGVGKPATKR